MRDTFQLLHLLTAIFAIGPMAHFATTAAKALRSGSAERIRETARLTRLYSALSFLPVLFGFGLMSQKGRSGKPLGEMSDTWIWGSTVLWMVAVALAFLVLAPALDKAADGDRDRARGKVAAVGGTIGLVLAAIVALMIFKP